MVHGAAETTGIPPEWLSGITLERDGEFMSKRIAEPLNYADGKTARLQKIVAEVREREKTPHVYVLAAFGNSHHTDSHFLEWVASQKLPAGEPIAVMINGDSPEPHPQFRYVKQEQLVTDAR